MANSKASKKLMNMVYGLGAAVVILGALFKIMHWTFGNEMLIIGLITEALVFTVSAFEPVDSDLDWSLVYPELAGGNKKDKKEKETPEGLLSKKLDDMLKEARLDTGLMSSLGDSIRNFEGAARNLGPTTDAIAGTRKYSEEMASAASHLESLNSLYKVQLESSSRQAEANQAIADNADKLKNQMESLTSNLSSLNGVYGGMLTAMNRS
ncbi:protein involved in gliding motility GldL [Aquimarina sp. MAR_2010_214]|uniref:type IX secretion system motor protein PorL/GldL n=1 Tax=Aquimarina sp. MAR_2010_214 TaxID=1250026 RepID=UPI000C711806|nr:gliding motility protein GldL [Aquimarina sp. MAR_2010_214]PKV48106.1 protein involved in gliding motility GldL [Aquimarina sp. MAR_2010_214]